MNVLELKETMDTYIKESPKVLKQSIRNGEDLVRELVELYANSPYKDIKIIASGSSYNASYCAKDFLEKILGVSVQVITPYTFVHYSQKDDQSFKVVVSQSGASTNSIEALDFIKELKEQAIGITGDVDSELKNHCDTIVDYGVGIEKVGFVTKGVVTLTLFLDLFALYSAKKLEKITDKFLNEKIEEINRLIDAYPAIYDKTQAYIKHNFSLFTSMHQVNILGNGSAYAVALEGALKIGETVCIPAFAYESEEFLHGPNLQLTPTYSTFILDANDETTERSKEIFNAVASVCERSFYIGIGKDEEDQRKLMIDCQVTHELLPFVYLQVFQSIAFQVTDALNGWHGHPVFKQNFHKKIQYKKYE